MKKSTKLWLITATALILTGCIILMGVMMLFNMDFSKLSTNKYQTKEYAIGEDFKNIAVITDTADIDFVVSEKCKVVCHEPENATHTVTVNEGALAIKLTDERKWYEHIGINFDTPKITVYLPKGEYGDLSLSASTGDTNIPTGYAFSNIFISKSTGHVTCSASSTGTVTVKTTTGNILVENMEATNLDLSVTTGKVTVSGVTCRDNANISVTTGDTNLINLTCKNLSSNGKTGDIDLKNVVASETFSVTRSTGDVEFDSCDAAEISITTSTGDVEGTLLSEKVFMANADTGSVHVPKTVTGGKCEITTDTGDIRISLK